MCGFWEQPGKLTDDKEAKVTRHSGCSTAVYIEPVLPSRSQAFGLTHTHLPLENINREVTSPFSLIAGPLPFQTDFQARYPPCAFSD